MKSYLKALLMVFGASIFIVGTLLLPEDITDEFFSWYISSDQVYESANDGQNTSNGEHLIIDIIDVGQADAVLFQAGGETMLIDAGDRGTAQELVSYIESQGISKIDYLIATHPHADHIGGMADVVESFEIGKIYMPNKVHTTRTFENLLLTIDEQGYPIHIAEAGISFRLGEEVIVEMLGPLRVDYRDLNDVSTVVKVTNGEDTFMFTGDAEHEAEEDLVASGANLQADVLKLGHHGSRTSTTEEFLQAVDPEYALISCGVDNSYGHPHPETLEKLERYQIPYYSTAESGTITIISTGNGYTITTER